jgi:glycosyltransferase involved in cell wall biosynthesis
MKILFCISTFGGGGAERQLALLATKMVELDCEVHVVFLRGGANLARLADSGVVLHQLQVRGHYDPRLFIKICAVVRSVKPNIIHTWLTQMDIVGGLSALLLGIPLVVSERSSKLGYSGGWKDKLRLQIGKRSASVVANSNGGLDYWRENGLLGHHYVVPNIVSQKERMRLDGGISQVVYAGRLIKSKNILPMTQAFKIVNNARTDVVFTYFGEGPLLEALLALQKKLSLNKVLELKGYSDGWLETLADAPLFVSSSAFEGCPNSVIEAAASGCPLVLSDIPEHRAIFDDSCAVFVNGENPESIATGILAMLNNPNLAKKSAINSWQRIGHWTGGEIARRYIEIYQHILTSKYIKSPQGVQN